VGIKRGGRKTRKTGPLWGTKPGHGKRTLLLRRVVTTVGLSWWCSVPKSKKTAFQDGKGETERIFRQYQKELKSRKAGDQEKARKFPTLKLPTLCGNSINPKHGCCKTTEEQGRGEGKKKHYP